MMELVLKDKIKQAFGFTETVQVWLQQTVWVINILFLYLASS